MLVSLSKAQPVPPAGFDLLTSRAPDRFAARQTSSFLIHMPRSLACEHGSRFPVAWERNRVLRTLRTQLPAKTIRMHALQGFRDAPLVSIDEPGDVNGRGRVQRSGRVDLFASIGCRCARACGVPRVAMVRL